jgi:acyl-CoA synthetase (AMP-forming)/AMP-acid ligase II
MTGPDGSLTARIDHARTFGTTPPSRHQTDYDTIGALLDHRAAGTPDDPFLIFLPDGGERISFSYADIHDLVLRTSAYLATAGIGRGDRVAVVAHNHSDTVIQYLACWVMGAVVVPVNVGEDDRRIRFILSDSGSRLAFVRREYLGRLMPLLGEMPEGIRIVSAGGGPGEAPPGVRDDFNRILEGTPLSPGDRPAVAGGDDALIVYTSGTTGNPKGVLLTQYNLLVDAMAISSWHAMSPGERMMCVLPIHHVNGIVVTLVTPMYYGGSVVLHRKFHTHTFFTSIASERVGVVSVVPTLLQFLLHAFPDGDMSPPERLRHIICGAGPLTCELAKNFESRFGVPIVHGYGLSETTCYSCFLPLDLTPAEHRAWLTDHGFPSIGQPLPVNEMAIHDESGNPLPEGARGEIVIRGHNVMRRYFGSDELNDRTFAHGWFRSGDEGFFRRDRSGRPYFFITGRLKELIIRGGTNISPFEIDEVLMNIPGVKAGLAVGFDNEWYGEEVGAYVQRVAGSGVTEEEIIGECGKALPYHKCPKVVLFGDDIPVTSTGKYQRSKLRPLFGKWKSVQFRGGKTP